MGWTTGFGSRQELVIFLRYRVQTGSRTHPDSYPISTGALYPGVKQVGREADHSLPYSVEVKNEWGYTFTHPYVFMAWCLVKPRDNFTYRIGNY
jgi:hypothetical protein